MTTTKIMNPLKFEPESFYNSKLIQAGALLMLLLTSCATHTPPHKHLVVPKTMRNGIKVVTSRTDLRQVMWWKKMHDPQLNHLIKTALINNNQLKTAKANILQAQAQLKEARFAWLPTLKASGAGFVGGGWDTNFRPEGPLALSPTLSKLGSISFHGYFSGFVPSYTLNVLENIQKSKFAYASLAVQEATYQSTRLSIISQISGAYFMLLGQKEQLNDQAAYICDLKRLRNLEWSRYQEGASDLSTVTNLDQQIVSNQATLTTLENSLAQVENSIQTLLNRNPGPLVKQGQLNTLSIQGLIPKNLPSSVLKNRPDIIIARQNLKMAEANIGIAYANFFPTISLTGLLGSSSFELAHLLSLSTGLWIAEAAASIPVLNGVTYEQIKEAKAGYLSAYFTYLQTLRAAFADVDNSLTNQQKMNKAYQNQLSAQVAAKKGYALALARYQGGAKDYRDVINAQLTVDLATLNLTLAKMQQLDSIVGVYQSLAAGYC